MPRASDKATSAAEAIPTEPPEDFGISLKQLRDLSEVSADSNLCLVRKQFLAYGNLSVCCGLQNRNKDELEGLGGLSGLAESLRTNLTAGIDSQADAPVTIDQRQQAYGANRFKDVPQKAFFRLFWENLKDPTLVLLMAAALVSCATLNVYAQHRIVFSSNHDHFHTAHCLSCYFISFHPSGSGQ